MKLPSRTIPLTATLLLALFLLGCTTSPSVVAIASRDDIAVTIDPRVELVTIAQGLSDYPYQGLPLTLGYGRDVRKHFAHVADHELVRFIEARAPRGFGFDAPVVLALSVDPEDYSRYRHEVALHYRRRAGGAEGVALFAELMASFARDSRFAEFYRRHGEEYAKWAQQFARELEQWPVRETLEEFFGTPLSNPTVVLSGMMKGARFGPLIGKTGEGQTSYVVMGRTSEALRDGRLEPTFRVDAGTVRALYHELSHTVVNPLTAQYAEEVAALSDLAEPLRERLGPQGYPKWEDMLNEHIVLAVETYLAFADDPRMREAALDRYEGASFQYVRRIYELVERYGAGRDGEGAGVVANFGLFYPQVLLPGLTALR